MFTFEKATISSNSFKEDGIVIIPNFSSLATYKDKPDLYPLFVPQNRAVPFFPTGHDGFFSEYFDNDDLDSIFNLSPNIINLWKELIDADVTDFEFDNWDLLDVNSKIIINVASIESYGDNALEVKISEDTVFDSIIEIAFEQDFLLSKRMYEEYMKYKNITKQELFEYLKEMKDNGSYTKKVDNLLQ